MSRIPQSTRGVVSGSGVIVNTGSNSNSPGNIDIQEGTSEAILAAGSNLGSIVVSIRLFDENGNSIQPDSDLEICLESEEKSDDLCLGSYSEETGKWECDDPCLEENSDGFYCGDVDHLTNFALLLQGGGSGGCGSSANDYILGSAFNDLMLIMSCALFCIIFIFIAVSSNYVIHRKTKLGKKRDGIITVVMEDE